MHPARTSRILDLVDPALGPAIVVPEDASVAELRAAANKARVLVLDASQQVLNDRVAQLSLHACLWAGSPGMAQALAFQLGARAAPGVAPRVACWSWWAANRVSMNNAPRCRPPARSASRTPTRSAPTLASCSCRRPRNPTAIRPGCWPGWSGRPAALMAHSFDALIATGGDTMAALLDAQGIHAFTLLSELEPGFPLGVTGLAGRDRSLLLAMKAGGFGGPDTARRRLAPARSITVPSLLEPSMLPLCPWP